MMEMKIKINKDESIEAVRKVDAVGSYEASQRYWLKFTMPALIEENLKQKVRLIADSAVLKNYEIKNVADLDQPVFLQYAFSAPQYFTKAGSSRLMSQLDNIDTSGYAKDTRRYPVEFGGLEEQEDRIEIELPLHLAVKYVPEPVVRDTKWFYFSSRYEAGKKGVLRFVSLHRTKERVVTPEEYPAYKKLLEEMVPLVNQQVVLEEKK
jgi:hypothetical protein